MKPLTLIIWLCLSVMPSFAQNSNGQGQNGGGGYHAAPVPLIRLGFRQFCGWRRAPWCQAP